MSPIVMRVTHGADNDSSASWGGYLTLATFTNFNTEDAEGTEKSVEKTNRDPSM